MSIAPHTDGDGASPERTYFVAPEDIPVVRARLRVIANGIASAPSGSFEVVAGAEIVVAPFP